MIQNYTAEEMKYSILPASEIEKPKFNEQIIRDTTLQVIKDFANFDMEVSFPGDISFAYESLFFHYLCH